MEKLRTEVLDRPAAALNQRIRGFPFCWFKVQLNNGFHASLPRFVRGILLRRTKVERAADVKWEARLEAH